MEHVVDLAEALDGEGRNAAIGPVQVALEQLGECDVDPSSRRAFAMRFGAGSRTRKATWPGRASSLHECRLPMKPVARSRDIA